MNSLEKITVHRQSEGYNKWVDDGSRALRERLPFKGSADLAVTIGSAGMASLVGKMQFAEPPVSIPFSDIGLPIGENQNHPKSILAGVTTSGKNIIIVQGRTHEYEIRKNGLETEAWGTLTPSELATGYLAMLSQIGVENMILTNASGGINHPLRKDDPKPFDPKGIPVVAVIGSDIDMAFPNANLGRYKGEMGDFFSLRDPDPNLADKFRWSLMKARNTDVPPPTVHYVTSPSTPSFEDPATIKLVAEAGGQAVGMSYSPEKQIISGLKGIKNFMGITIITNLQELGLKGVPDEGQSLSVEEMRYHYAHEFEKKFTASDEEVRENAKLVEGVLSEAIAGLAGMV